MSKQTKAELLAKIEKALSEAESGFAKAQASGDTAFGFAGIIGTLKGELKNLAIEIEYAR